MTIKCTIQGFSITPNGEFIMYSGFSNGKAVFTIENKRGFDVAPKEKADDFLNKRSICPLGSPNRALAKRHWQHITKFLKDSKTPSNFFVIISDEGLLRAGNISHERLDKLMAAGIYHARYTDDFVRDLSEERYSLFLPRNHRDIERLYDETNSFGLSWSAKERLLEEYNNWLATQQEN